MPFVIVNIPNDVDVMNITRARIAPESDRSENIITMIVNNDRMISDNF
tara:strand:- start:154 stop:297 length:144 start_codon:yes stop_codon:yes gene_type:complete